MTDSSSTSRGPTDANLTNHPGSVTDMSEFDDIPGTTVFTAQRSRKGYWLNQFCMSLMKPENRARFKADERAYLDEWPMSEAQKQAVLARDYNAAIAEGGNIYFLAKIFASDGKSFQDAAGSMTGMSPDEYAAMMLAGGRSPEGWRSIRERR
jgi:protocatechuate 4,5-dioxygenase alpha chain